MKILIVSRIDDAAVVTLGQDHEIVEAWEPGADIGALINDCDALIFRSGVEIDDTMLALAPRLKLIIRAGSGADNIDLSSVHDRGIRFERIPKPGAQAVAELAFALMLALARQLFFADAQWRRGKWVKNAVEGHLLAGKNTWYRGSCEHRRPRRRHGRELGHESDWLRCISRQNPEGGLCKAGDRTA